MRSVLLGDSNDVLDEESRPIGEVRASPEMRSTTKTLYGMCPYRGSRERAPRMMNLSALSQVTSAWPQPLGVLGYVRRLHGMRPGVAPPLIDLCRMCFSALCLPAYLAYRRRPSAIPVRTAAMHKMTQGLFGLCKNLLIDSVARGEDFRHKVADVGELYRFAERSGALLSRTGIEACAAPPELIGQALRLLVLGDAGGDGGHALPVDGWDEDGSQLLSYSAAVADITLWTSVAAIALMAWMERAMNGAAGRAARDGYLLSGFSDPVIAPVLGLDDGIRHAYALGAIAVCPNDATRAALRGMLDLAPVAPVAFPASGSNHASSWTGSVSRIEHEALLIFDRLQARVLTALGRPALPPASLAAAVTEAFGHLPSHYLAQPGACLRRGEPLPLERHA